MEDIPHKQKGFLGWVKLSTFFPILAIILIGAPLWISSFSQKTEAEFTTKEVPIGEMLSLVQNNSILPYENGGATSLAFQEKVNRLPVVVTAYSSSPQETDADPYTTAAGTRVRQGIVANNLLPLGTKIRFPELYGNRIFVVEDRMNKKKRGDQIDIWFPSYDEARSFGTKRTYIEVLD